MKKAIRNVCKILVERGDFETVQEAFDAHKEDFQELIDMINKGNLDDLFEAENFFVETFGLEPDYFEGLVFAFV